MRNGEIIIGESDKNKAVNNLNCFDNVNVFDN